jgi:Fe-S-cluster-containing dehydrogenase component
MQRKRLRFNGNICFGCMQCVLACNYILDKTMGVTAHRTRIHIHLDAENLHAKADLCTKCAMCTRVCPTIAMSFNDNGTLHIDYSLCTNACRVCVDACPSQVLILDNGKPIGCTDCLKCVESCEPKALIYA